MKCETIRLKDHYDCVAGGVLKIFCLDEPFDTASDWVRPMVIVVPGGGYRFVSKREGEPIAADFLAKGYHACVLEYLCEPQGVHYPEQLLELACAVDYIKKNAARLFVNSDEVFAVGFSAGGHLVADYAVEYATLSERFDAPLETGVKAVGLCYPVINDHEESFESLLHGYPDEEKSELKENLKVNRRVTESTPPTFLWTTATDKTVPAQNTLRYALALAQNGVPYELHVYPKGSHGAANGSVELNKEDDSLPVLSSWTKDMARFFRGFCREKY